MNMRASKCASVGDNSYMKCNPPFSILLCTKKVYRQCFISSDKSHPNVQISGFQRLQHRGVWYPIWLNSIFEFCQKMVHSIFDSIFLYPRFNSKYLQFKENWYCLNRKSAPKVFKIDKKGTLHQKWQILIQNMIHSFISR